ncbi:MAG TPA: hypothetical protein VE093_26235 [Polyangiaceae bacterium]|jgi:hypothetical protein|nr:hypothetical protein [Polyangiaceae bacterium]
MSERTWLRLQGMRYRCTPLFLPVDELDPLCRLFLDVLKHEKSIPRLLRAFGLPGRIVENVLGDLVRRNRAVLVVQDGIKEVHLLDGTLPSVTHVPGDSLDVWQEQVTGLVLPAWMVDSHHRPRVDGVETDDVEAMTLAEEGDPIIERFLDAPDAQLIDVLLRCDEELRYVEGSQMLLDRLAERFRVRPQAVWLPVIDADIQGRKIPLLTSDHVPAWIMRVWSVALRRRSLTGPTDHARIRQEGMSPADADHLLWGWRVGRLAELWRDAVENVLRQTPAPVSGFDLKEVRAKQAPLAGILLAMGRVELVDAPVGRAGLTAWLEPTIDQARHWAIIVLPPWCPVEALIEMLRRRADGGARPPSNLLVVATADDARKHVKALQEVLGSTSFGAISVRKWMRHGPAVAVCDSAESRLRQGPTAPILQMSGSAFASELLLITQLLAAQKNETEEDHQLAGLIRRFRPHQDTILVRDDARLGGGTDAPTAASVLDELRGYLDMLLGAIVDPGGHAQGDTDAEEDPGAQRVNPKFSWRQPLGLEMPRLGDQRDRLAYHLSLAPSEPWCLWSGLPGHQILSVLIAMLTEPQRRRVAGELVLLTTCLGANLSQTSIPGLIEAAVKEHGWVLTIAWAATGDGAIDRCSLEQAEALRAKIPSPRLQFRRFSGSVPAHAIVLNDVVFLAGGAWLGDVLEPGKSPGFGFAIESLTLAETLRSQVAEATEIDVQARVPPA